MDALSARARTNHRFVFTFAHQPANQRVFDRRTLIDCRLIAVDEVKIESNLLLPGKDWGQDRSLAICAMPPSIAY